MEARDAWEQRVAPRMESLVERLSVSLGHMGAAAVVPEDVKLRAHLGAMDARDEWVKVRELLGQVEAGRRELARLGRDTRRERSESRRRQSLAQFMETVTLGRLRDLAIERHGML